MSTNQYQVWEGEMEAAGLEENGVSLFAAISSALLGILLFSVLILKTVAQLIFKAGAKRKGSSTIKTSELNMSVS